ncbi:MAG: hypothetical protein P9L89_04160 [Candidatus Celaenobacter polaris]|nr:hypothetical protein [Candidatus Celaenobacter polaris]
MKKVICVLMIILMVSITLFSEVLKRMPVFVISPTTGVFSGIRVGVGLVNIYENHVWEMTLNYKNELISHVAGPEITFKPMNSGNFDSVYLQANRFWNHEREKSFLILKVGVFLCPAFTFATDGGINDNKKDLIIPLVTVGYGYSFSIKDLIYLRPSIDLGLQSNLINVGLAITF